MINDIKNRLITDELPSLPSSAQQIMQLALDPDVSLDLLANGIKKDVGLSTRIIQLVNTPRYCSSGSITDLQQAVVTLGLNTVKNLALSLSVLDVMNDDIDKKVYTQIFNLSLCNATTTQVFSSLKNIENLNQAFFCGLVQYFGLFVLAGAMKDMYWVLYEESIKKGLRFTKVLEDNLHLKHNEIGFKLAKKWQLPELVCNSLNYQEAPLEAARDGVLKDDIKIFETIHLSMIATEIYIGPGKSINIERFKSTYSDFYEKTPRQAENRLMKMGKKINESLDIMNIDIPRQSSYTAVLKEANRELSSMNVQYEQMYHDMTQSNEKLAKLNSKLKDKNKTLAKIAAYDFLTGVHNRTRFEKELEKYLFVSKRHSEKLAILFIDLDNFKLVNDLHGNVFGDQVLYTVAQLLSKSIRQDEFLARIGGDEFAVILPKLSNEQEAANAARRIINLLTAPLDVQGKSLFITTSIGIACFPYAGETIEELIKSADQAMHRAKDEGKNNFRYFTEELSLKSMRRLELETAFNEAIDNNEFFMVYQPIIDIKDNKLFGFEALMRWSNDKLGDISPVEFIPHVEENGKIKTLGRWGFEECIKQISQLEKSGINKLVYAINISPKQLLESDFFDFIKAIVDKYKVGSSSLEVELTENEVMENINQSGEILKKIIDFGIRTNIDDFGTGHSSLMRLKKIPFNALKIDRSFVQDMLVDKNSAIIVDAIISMSKSLGLKTIAEGIEYKEQLDFLTNLGCDFGQGYYFSKPINFSKIPSLVKQFKDKL